MTISLNTISEILFNRGFYVRFIGRELVVGSTTYPAKVAQIKAALAEEFTADEMKYLPGISPFTANVSVIG